MKDIAAAKRLIIAADFVPSEEGGRTELRSRVLQFASRVSGNGSLIKLNSLGRALGYDLIDELHNLFIGAFADLKLVDIGETLAHDGILLRESKPEFVTAMSSAPLDSLRRLKGELSNSKILGVSVLTTLDDEEVQEIFGWTTIREATLRLGARSIKAGLDGLICAPGELALLRQEFGDEPWLVSPNVRFADGIVAGDDQNPKRAMTPAQAMQAGADCVVMGRPITLADDPVAQARRAVDEIALALEEV